MHAIQRPSDESGSAFFLANEYARSLGAPGLLDKMQIAQGRDDDVAAISQQIIGVASGRLEVVDLAGESCYES